MFIIPSAPKHHLIHLFEGLFSRNLPSLVWIFLRHLFNKVILLMADLHYLRWFSQTVSGYQIWMELWPCMEFHYTLVGSLKETFSRGQSSPAKPRSSVDFIPIKFHSDSLWNSSLHQINSTKWHWNQKHERKQTSTNSNSPLFDWVFLG